MVMMVMTGAAVNVPPAAPTRRVQGKAGSRGGSDRTGRVDELTLQISMNMIYVHHFSALLPKTDGSENINLIPIFVMHPCSDACTHTPKNTVRFCNGPAHVWYSETRVRLRWRSAMLTAAIDRQLHLFSFVFTL